MIDKLIDKLFKLLPLMFGITCGVNIGFQWGQSSMRGWEILAKKATADYRALSAESVDLRSRAVMVGFYETALRQCTDREEVLR